MTRTRLTVRLGLGAVTGLGLGMGPACGDGYECGPDEAVVARVIDGDTIELDSGERVRYLLVDTPEVSGEQECFGVEATAFNRTAVEGERVRLSYDTECTDSFDRLLAYVTLDNGRVINELLLERGYACVLQIPPNGSDFAAEYRALEAEARDGMVGLWGQCLETPC